MKNTLTQLKRKIRGRARAIAHSKEVARKSLHLIKDKMSTPKALTGIIGAVIIVSGTTLGLILRKKKVITSLKRGSRKLRMAHQRSR